MTSDGFRTELLRAYEIPKLFYAMVPKRSAARILGTLGSLLGYAFQIGYMSRKKRTLMDVDAMVEKWHKAVVGLAVAHDKDEADRYEAGIEQCLLPILAAPIRQLREFAPKLLSSLKADAQVPFLVWRAYEVWLEATIDKAPDEGVIELKTHLAREVAQLVEQDVKAQLGEALVRALQWRSSETLEKMKEVVTQEKAKGKRVRLRGRETCLFVEAGGTEKKPVVCVQL